MSWLAVGLVAVGWSALTLVLGACVGFSLGLGRTRSVLLSPLLFCFALALLTVLSPLFGWSLFYVVVGFAVFSAAVLAARSLGNKTSPLALVLRQCRAYASPISPSGKKMLAWCSAGLLVEFSAVLFLFAWSCGSPQTVLQNYDSAFQLSVVRHVVETLNASPVGAGSVMGSGNAVYPDLWHALCALVYVTGIGEIVPSMWMTFALILGCFAPVCLCALSWVLMGRPSGPVAFLSMLSPVVFQLSVFHFIIFGPLNANLLGLVLMPAAIAWFSIEFEAGFLTQGIGRKVFVVFVCVFATGMAHPNTAFILLIFALCLMCARVSRAWVKVAWISLGAGIWFACAQSALFRRTINCLDRVGSSAEKGEDFFATLHLDYAFFADSTVFLLLFVFALFAAFCVAAFLLRRVMPGSWMIAGIGFFVAESILSSFPTNPVSVALTGFWYRDYYRFRVIAGYLTEPTFIAFCASVIFALRNRTPCPDEAGLRGKHAYAKRPHLVANSLIALCLVAFCAIAVQGASSLNRGLASVTKDAVGFTSEQEEFSQEVAAYAGSVGVLNNFNDESIWLYPLYGVNAALKGQPANQIESMADDLCFVIENIDKVEGDARSSAVRDALDRLGIAYVVKMSDNPNTTTRMNELEQIVYTREEAICQVNAETPGFSLVLERDGMQLLCIED